MLMNKQTALKRFLNKWHKQNLALRIFFLLILVLYTASLIWFTIELLTLTNIETLIRSIVLGILYVHLLIYLLGGLILLFTKKNKRFIFLLVLTFIYTPLLTIGAFYIDKTYNIIDTVQKKYVDYTSVMISLNATEDYKKIGMIDDETDPTGYIIPNKMIKEQNITSEIVKYNDYIGMLTDLYEGKIDALFASESYVTMFNSYENFENIASETKIIYTKTEKLENIDNVSYSTKKLTEPFTMLLMGVDSTGEDITSGTSFNGDTLMLVTFNPKNLNATVFSIPRDTYVPIACRNNVENKINSSSYGGTSCVVNTIKNLTGIDIDYYVKINFTGVVKLVDDLGGIDVDVPIKFCEQDSQRRFGSYLICLDKGYQTLNGEQALAFSRHRKTLPRGDFQRVEHQQMVVEAMVNKLKNINNLDDFYKVLEDITKNIDTNMTTEQILSLYDVAKNILLNSKDSKLSIQKTYLSGYDLSMYMDNYRSYIYTFQYYRKSLQDIVDAMKVNLELDTPKPIKTFSFDINEPYELSVIGKSVYNEKRRELLPNFIGSSREYVENWARERNISLNVQTEDSTLPNGQVITQDRHVGLLVDKLTSLSITVARNTGNNIPIQNPDSNTNNNENENNNVEEEIKLPSFTGKTIEEFNSWRATLKNVNIITDTIELTPDEILTLGVTDLKNNTIYKQSVKEGTSLKEITTLKVYYYKESSE